MKDRNFRGLLEDRWSKNHFVCIGLDPELEKLPAGKTIRSFCERIVMATHDLVCAFKPNLAFFSAHGAYGWESLQLLIKLLNEIAPEVPVILDAKYADIGNTSKAFAQAAFEYLYADALTVNPYLGADALEPFLKRAEKGVFVLCRTTNKGAVEFQDLFVNGMTVYQHVADRVAHHWNGNGNCGLVVGATYTSELRQIREMVGTMPILIPGIGAQGGNLENAVRAGQDGDRKGMICVVGRDIIYAANGPDFAEAARRKTQEYDNLINQYRKGA